MADTFTPTRNFVNFGTPTTAPTQNYTNFTQPVQSQAGGNFFTNRSPETQAALIGTGASLLGGYLSQKNQNQQNQQAQDFSAQQAELNREQSNKTLTQQLAQQMQLSQQQAAMAGQQQSPVRQDWRQKQALMADILPGLRNVSVQAPGGLSRFQGNISGGLRLPEGGLSQQALSFFSPEARMNSEADLDKTIGLASGGQAPTPNYAGVGYGQTQGVGEAQQDVTDYSAKIKEQNQAQQLALMQMLGLSPQGQQQTPQTAGGAATANPFLR